MERNPSQFEEVNIEEPSYQLDYVNHSDIDSLENQQQQELRQQIQAQMEIELKSML